MKIGHVWAVMLLGVAVSCERPSADPRAATLVDLAWQHLQSRNYFQALELADSAATLYPRLADAHFIQGRVLFELHQFEASAEAYFAVLDLDPAYPGAHHNLGNALFGQRQYRRAIEQFRLEGSANSWHAVGAAYMEIGQPDSALSAFLLAASDTSYGPVHKSLAELYEQQGEFVRALEHARIANDCYLTGLMLFHLNRYEDAKSVLEELTAAEPWHHSAYYTLGQIHLRQGQTDQGQLLLGRAEALRQSHQEVSSLATSARDNPTSFAHQMAHANALRSAGRMAEAVEAWLIALALRPNNLDLQSNIATGYMQLGDSSQALRRFQRVLASDSAHVTTLVNLGWHFFGTGQQQRAVEAWGRAARHHPNHPAIHELRTTLQRQLPDSAQSSLEQP